MGKVLPELFSVTFIFRADGKEFWLEDTVQAQAVEAPLRSKIDAEITPAGLGAHKNLKRKSLQNDRFAGTGAVILKRKETMFPHGCKHRQKHFVLQCMHHKIVLPAEQIVGEKFPVQNGAACEAERRCL